MLGRTQSAAKQGPNTKPPQRALKRSKHNTLQNTEASTTMNKQQQNHHLRTDSRPSHQCVFEDIDLTMLFVKYKIV